MQQDRSPRAGGAIIALAVLAGAIVGARLGQPSVGVLAGVGAGVAAAALIWLLDRRR